MDRKTELLKAVDNDMALVRLVEDMVFMEGQLERLRELPMIRVNAEDPEKQKPTPASKLYTQTLTQYINTVKVLLKARGISEEDEESPLRTWLKNNRTLETR